MVNTNLELKKDEIESDDLQSQKNVIGFLPSFLSETSRDTLHSFTLKEIEDLLIQKDKLDIMSKNMTKVGSYSFVSKVVHQGNTHCILLELCVMKQLRDSEQKIVMTDLLSLELELLHHSKVNQTKDSCTKVVMETRLYVERIKSGFNVKYNQQGSLEKEFHIKVPEKSAFVTEGSCLFFQKLMAKRKLTGVYTFSSISKRIKNNPCKITLRTLGLKTQRVKEQDIETYIVEMDCMPWQKCCKTYQRHFSMNGMYLHSKHVGDPTTMTVANLPEECNILDFGPSFYEVQKKFLNSFGASDFDELMFPDYGHVVTSYRQHIGHYYVVVENMHYKGKHCFWVHIYLNVSYSDKRSTTMINSLVTSELRTLRFTKHQITESKDDSRVLKMSINCEDDTFKLEKTEIYQGLTVREQKVEIPLERLPNFCCEATGFLVMRLMVKKRNQNVIKFTTLDEEFGICETDYHCLGGRRVQVSGCLINAWKVQNTTTWRNGKVLNWEYNFTDQGNLLTRRQIDVPVLIIVPEELCKQYK